MGVVIEKDKDKAKNKDKAPQGGMSGKDSQEKRLDNFMQYLEYKYYQIHDLLDRKSWLAAEVRGKGRLERYD